PTEAAAIAASYGLFVGVFVYKGITRKNFFSICVECCTSSAVIIFLIAMASSFGYLLALEQVPETIAQAILEVSNNKYIILLLINLFLLVVGALMEPAAATIILTPILAPIAIKLGVDIIHFGLVMTVNLAIGFITPPVGTNLFVASATSGLKVEAIAKAALPMVALTITVLFLLTYVPAFSLFLPNMMM
ncbi:MAG: TRAP transporter large permease subunit, partial [Mailhella sp.]|nr:TRAP transporter large permease subunit [Mailhella sp.]